MISQSTCKPLTISAVRGALVGRELRSESAISAVPMGDPQRSKRNRGAPQVPTANPRMLQHPAGNMRPTVVCETGERCRCAAMVSKVLVPPKRVTSKLKWVCCLGMGTALERMEVTCRLLISITNGEMGLHQVLFPLGETVRSCGKASSETREVSRSWGHITRGPVQATGGPGRWNLQVPGKRPRGAPTKFQHRLALECASE